VTANTNDICAGGRLSEPPAQMAISTGSKLLAGAAPARTNRFRPSV
jgi:hypothetical protein